MLEDKIALRLQQDMHSWRFILC